jgi:hypothetical protein
MLIQDWAHVEVTLPEYRIELGGKLYQHAWKKGEKLGEYRVDIPGKTDQTMGNVIGLYRSG